MTREMVLESLRRLFTSLGCPVVADSGWKDFDLLIEANPWTRIEFMTAEEELGGLELKTNVAARLRLSNSARVGLGACILAAAIASLFGSALVAAALSIVAGGVAIAVISELAEAASLAYHAIEQSAGELNLVPLGKPAAPPRARPIPAIAEPDRPAEAAQPAGR